MSSQVAPTRVLYVGGMPRSGSTLIDLALGQLPDHVAVGELFYLWTAGLERNLKCGCGEHFEQCAFWQEVGERAFGGWDNVDRPEIARLRKRVDTTRSMPKLRTTHDDAFAHDLAAYTEILTALYAGIAATAGAHVVVDSSKRPSLAYILERASGVDLSLAHVVRDPRGVAFSWQKTVELPAGNTSKTHMPKWSPMKTSRRWVTTNELIARLGRRIPSVTIRSEDFVTEARKQILRVAELSE
ncbi:MAG TPA: sulfotransferase, partial [Actinomycetes bacterium]|nr:sulfotransferase [Actinomycetes bacterium]